MPLSPGLCQKICWGFLSLVPNSTGVTESLMLTILKICGCLLFQESEVLNSAPSMSGVAPGCDQRFRWSWSCGEEVKLLYFAVSLKLSFFWKPYMLPGYQVGSRSFFHLLLPVNCISILEEEWDKFKCSGMSSVFQFWSPACEWCDAGTCAKVMTVTSLLQRVTAMIINTRCPLNKNAFRHIQPCPS